MDKNSAVIKIIDFGLAKLVRPGEKVKFIKHSRVNKNATM